MPHIRLTMPLADLGQWLEKLGEDMPRVSRLGFIAAGMRILPLLHDRTRTAVPASTGGGDGAFNTGMYLRAWKSVPVPDGLRIYNASRYAGVIEFGRKPGSLRPPLAPLALWAQRKLGLTKVEAKSAAWGIAMSIKKRGLKPRRVMTGALPRMRKLVKEEMLAQILVHLAKKGG
jgi:hypothetical protein